MQTLDLGTKEGKMLKYITCYITVEKTAIRITCELCLCLVKAYH